MELDRPIISIITVVYNGVTTLEDTIKSIIGYLDKKTEYIIIDGGSSDGTTDIIKKYETYLSYWISEPDNGIYDAMNKGIKKALGSYVSFINCGDYLLNLPDNLNFNKSNISLYCFPVIQSNNKIIYPTNSLKLLFRNTLPHQGCYYRNDKYLTFNTKYRVFADFALNQKIKKMGLKIDIQKGPIVAYHTLDGISNNKAYSIEIFQVVGDNYGWFMKLTSYIYFRLRGIYYRLIYFYRKNFI